MYNDIVITLLEITEYKDDKEGFVSDFNRIVNSQALVALVQTLPVEKREEADKKIASADSPEAFTKAVHSYFTKEQVQTALDTAAAQAITQWIASIADTLDDVQREKLVTLSNRLQDAMAS